jgi:hypothetical protein
VAGRDLLPVDQAGAPDRFLQPGAHIGVQRLERSHQGIGRDPDAGGPDAVEPLGEIEQGVHAAGAHVLAEGPDPLDGVLDVERRARDHATQRAGSQGLAAQVESTDHPVESRHGAPGAPGRDPPSARRTALSSLCPWRRGYPCSR